MAITNRKHIRLNQITKSDTLCDNKKVIRLYKIIIRDTITNDDPDEQLTENPTQHCSAAKHNN